MGLKTRIASARVWLAAGAVALLTATPALALPAPPPSICPDNNPPAFSIGPVTTDSTIPNDEFYGTDFSIDGAVDGDGLYFSTVNPGDPITVNSHATVDSTTGLSGNSGIVIEADGAICYDGDVNAAITGADAGLEVNQHGNANVLLNIAHSVTGGSAGVVISHSGDGDIDVTTADLTVLFGGGFSGAGLVISHFGTGTINATVNGKIDVQGPGVGVLMVLGDSDATLKTLGEIDTVDGPGILIQKLGDGNVTVETSGNITTTDAGIAVSQSADLGDLKITTKAGTTIAAHGGFGPPLFSLPVGFVGSVGIYATRDAGFIGTGTGALVVDNAANLEADAVGIYVDICGCSDVAADITSSGDITAPIGIFGIADGKTDIKVTGGTITAGFAGVAALAADASITIGKGASVLSSANGIAVAPDLLSAPGASGKGTITIAGTVTAPIVAVTLGAADNTLILEGGYAIGGLVEAFGTTNNLVFGGIDDASFDLGLLGTQYFGFSDFFKTGTSNWTLTGTNSGTFEIDADAGTITANADAPNLDIVFGTNATGIVNGTLNDVTTHGSPLTINASGVVHDIVSVGSAVIMNGTARQMDVNGGSLTVGGTMQDVFARTGAVVTVGAGGTVHDIEADASAVTVNGTAHDVTVTGGSLNGDGHMHDVVLFAATLMGNPTLNSLTTHGGMVTPGHSIGTVTVVGNVALGAGTVYTVEANAAGLSDKIVAGGTGTIDATASVAAVPLAGTYGPSTTYAILTAAGGVTGTFGGVTSSSVFLNAALSYDATNAYLTLTRNGTSVASVAQTPNQKAVATTLDALGGAAPYLGNLLVLSAADVPGALDALSGDGYAGIVTASTDDPFLRDATLDRRGSRGAWARSYGGYTSLPGDGNGPGVNVLRGGEIIGADGKLGDLRLGALMAIGEGRFGIPDRRQSATSSDVSVGGYGGVDWNQFYLSFGGTLTRHDIESTRTVSFAGVNDTFKSRYGLLTGEVYAEAGYRFDAAGVGITPFAGLAAIGSHADGFSETGPGAGALSGTGSDALALVSTLGVRLDSQFVLGDDLHVTVSGTAAWRHTTGGQATANNDLPVGAAFAVVSAPLPADAFVLTAKTDFEVSEALTLSLAYTGALSNGGNAHAVTATLTGSF